LLASVLDCTNGSDAIDVALYVVASERITDSKRRFEIRRVLEPFYATERFRNDVEFEPPVLGVDDGQADPVDGDRVANVGRDAAFDDKAAVFEGCNASALLHDSGEHATKATHEREGGPRPGPPSQNPLIFRTMRL
jgi:hypothetical protein